MAIYSLLIVPAFLMATLFQFCHRDPSTSPLFFREFNVTVFAIKKKKQTTNHESLLCFGLVCLVGFGLFGLGFFLTMNVVKQLNRSPRTLWRLYPCN